MAGKPQIVKNENVVKLHKTIFINKILPKNSKRFIFLLRFLSKRFKFTSNSNSKRFNFDQENCEFFDVRTTHRKSSHVQQVKRFDALNGALIPVEFRASKTIKINMTKLKMQLSR